MQIHIFQDYESLSLKACEIITHQIQKKPNSVLGLATGSSPLGLYKKLIESYQDGKISFHQCISFNLDEYIGIDQKHPQSYYTFMQHHLFKHINIPIHQTFMPSHESHRLEDSCNAYNALLKKYNIDIQILGIGRNGHIGFNEPKTPFDQETFIVKLDQATRIDNQRFFKTLDDVPTHAITMGIKNIMQSKKIILIATGDGKAEAVYQMIKGPVTCDLPASALQNHKDLIVLLDESAAKLL